jgi:hypothetical protein
MTAGRVRLGIAPALTCVAYAAQAFRSARARWCRPEGLRYGTRALAPRVRSGLGRAFTTAAVVVIGGSSSLLACPMCFGAEETSMIDGTKFGVLVMLAITLAVQGAFVSFFLYLRRRARRIAEVDLDTEWSELQGVSRTS